MEKEVNKLEELGDFTPKNSSDITFDMYKNFADSEESLRKYGDAFSDFYYISCLVIPDEAPSLEGEEEGGEGIVDQVEDDEECIDWNNVGKEQKIQWENAISKFKKYPGLYNVLQRCSYHMQNRHPLEILIGKYSEESMAKARRLTEERRKEFEGMGFIVRDPSEYVYILGFFGGSAGRANQEIIRDIKDMFPDKVKEIKLGVIKTDNKKEGN